MAGHYLFESFQVTNFISEHSSKPYPMRDGFSHLIEACQGRWDILNQCRCMCNSAAPSAAKNFLGPLTRPTSRKQTMPEIVWGPLKVPPQRMSFFKWQDTEDTAFCWISLLLRKVRKGNWGVEPKLIRDEYCIDSLPIYPRKVVFCNILINAVI